MFNNQLTAFVCSVDSGSFTKAADSLHISPTAVMKQLNSLEDHLNLKLIDRSTTGVKLTPAGEVIYKDALFMIDYSKKSIESARLAGDKNDNTFCVGTSILNPAKPFMDLWYRVNHDFSDYKLHIVPFEDDHTGILSEIELLGQKFDFLIGVCDSRQWLRRCNMLPLGNYCKMCAVPADSPLAKKRILEISDLFDQTLMMVREGDSGTNDFIRNDIITNYPQINIEDTDAFYDISVFNRCVEKGNVLLSLECWQDVHPGLVTLPVNWSYTAPYGLLYAQNPSDDVLKFVNSIKGFI